MNISRFFITFILLLTLSTYSKNLKWGSLSEAAEATNNAIVIEASETAKASKPVIKALVDGTTLDTTTPNHVTLPLTIMFTSDQPTTIYYTTNGELPTTSTTTYAIIENANDTAAGPTIRSYDNMLMLLGVDKAGSLTPLLTYTLVAQRQS